MSRIPVLLALLALAFPGASGAAEDCKLGPAGRVAQGGYYVEQRANNDVWVYQETNGLNDLQRGGRSDFGDKDRCVDDPLVVPDRIVL